MFVTVSEKIVRDPNKDAKLKEMLQATSLQQPIDFEDFNYKEYLTEQKQKDYEKIEL